MTYATVAEKPSSPWACFIVNEVSQEGITLAEATR